MKIQKKNLFLAGLGGIVGLAFPKQDGGALLRAGPGLFPNSEFSENIFLETFCLFFKKNI